MSAGTAPPTTLAPIGLQSRPRWADYFELTKPGIGLMVVVAVGIAAFVASYGQPDALRIVTAMAATGMLGGGASVLNHWWERESDKRMHRTAKRPIPTGRVSPTSAFVFGILLIILGTGILWRYCNLQSAACGLISAMLYILIYTPMKQVTVWNTALGAVPGALPMLIGWLAVRGTIEPAGWMLFALLFAWQFPHFYAIAWIYREDYAAAGMKMFPSSAVGQRYTGLQTVAFCLLLFAISLAPPLVAIGGLVYAIGATMFGVYFLTYAVAFKRRPSPRSAKMLMLSSLVYLPAVLGLLAISSVYRG